MAKDQTTLSIDFEDICQGRHHEQLYYEKDYDPAEEFDPEDVVFDDPQERWKEAMSFR